MMIPINDSYPVAVLVQVKGNGTLGREEAMMAAVATARGVPVIEASDKQVERGKVVVAADRVAVGSISFVRSALRRLGQQLPPHEPYPEPFTICYIAKSASFPRSMTRSCWLAMARSFSSSRLAGNALQGSSLSSRTICGSTVLPTGNPCG